MLSARRLSSAVSVVAAVGGTVSGVLTAPDVIGPALQGVPAGEFAEFIRALRASAAYGNVHTAAFPGGEIRGQVTFRDRHDD
jgi:CHRD domain